MYSSTPILNSPWRDTGGIPMIRERFIAKRDPLYDAENPEPSLNEKPFAELGLAFVFRDFSRN
jgi:hypothetical protein